MRYTFKDSNDRKDCGQGDAASVALSTKLPCCAGVKIPEGFGRLEVFRDRDGTIHLTFTPSAALLIRVWQEDPVARGYFAHVHREISNTIAGKPCNEVAHRWVPVWDGFEGRPYHTTMRRWMGESTTGRHLLVCDSFGIGDSLQFLAFLPTLKEALGLRRVTFLSRPALARLASASGLADFVTSDPATIRAEVFADISNDLWYYHGKRASVPFLKPVEMDAAEWGCHLARITPPRSLRVGLVWHGSVAGDQDRNVDPALYACLSDMPGVRLFAVQKGPTEGAYTKIPGCISLSAGIGDMPDTAAILANMDLLITCDTSVAHLAGGMGIPAWVLLPTTHCPRWHAVEQWYPSVRTYTARRRGQWSDVLSAVRADLMALSERKRTS